MGTYVSFGGDFSGPVQEEIRGKICDRITKKSLLRIKKVALLVHFGDSSGPICPKAFKLHTHNRLMGTHVLMYVGGARGLEVFVFWASYGDLFQSFGDFSGPVCPRALNLKADLTMYSK